MNTTLRNILAVLAGFIVGNLVNMGIIMLGPSIIPLPEGVDPSNLDSILANTDQYQIKHFITPFLAHALGTFVAAFTAVKIALSHKKQIAMGLGIVFLLFGAFMAYLIPAFKYFAIVDLVFAYIPFALLGYKVAKG